MVNSSTKLQPNDLVFMVVEKENLSKKVSLDNQTGIRSKQKPKLLVIPFVNTNKDEDSEYLVDGIVEDLITEFSMIKELDILDIKIKELLPSQEI